VRLVVLLALSGSLFFTHPVVDAEYHDAWAQCLASGEQRSDQQEQFLNEPFFKPPLYPYLLGAWYKAFGRNLWAVKTVQALLGALGCVLVFLITRRILGRAAAWIAAGLGAVYWPWIFFDAWLLNTELVIFLDLMGAWTLLQYVERRTAWRLIAGGLLFGLSAITWPTGLLVCLALSLWLAITASRGEPGSRRAAGLFLLAAALPVLLVAGRNRVIGEDWVLISSNGGINFYTGNRPEADGLSAVPTGIAWERLLREAKGQGITKASEASSYWIGKTFEAIQEAPGRFAGLTMKRAALYFNKAEPRNNLDQAYFQEERPWLKFLPGFWLLGPAWFLGLYFWCSVRGRPEAIRGSPAAGGWLLLTVIAARWACVLPFFVCDRFRVVAVPFMLPFAGLAAIEVFQLVSAKKPGKIVTVSMGLVAACMIVNVDWFGQADKSFSREKFFLGMIHLERNEREQAGAFLLEAVDLGENEDAWVMLSSLKLGERRFSEAAEAARHCLELAPDTPSAHCNLAQALLNLDQAEEAWKHADEAIRLEPDRALYRLIRAQAAIRLERTEEARLDLESLRKMHVTESEYRLYQHLQSRLK
jgi:4-amino-4-deoxy-L-arabinose transferase-like glycosyltransferase